MGDGGAVCGFLGLLAWWLWLMAKVIFQGAAPILALRGHSLLVKG
jgi:hypothetical protein